VDLDYFAALPDDQLDIAFERVFSWLLTLPRLQAITFAVSTPYLKDQSQAQRLVGLAMAAAVSVDNGTSILSRSRAPARTIPGRCASSPQRASRCQCLMCPRLRRI
jgi:hypothetical protein